MATTTVAAYLETHLNPVKHTARQAAAEAQHQIEALRGELTHLRHTANGFLADLVAEGQLERDDANRLLHALEAPPLKSSYDVRFNAVLTVTVEGEGTDNAVDLAVEHLTQLFETADDVEAEVQNVRDVAENDSDETRPAADTGQGSHS